MSENLILGTKDDLARIASVLISSGDVQLRQGKIEEAKDQLNQALDIYSKLGDRGGEAQCKTRLGWVIFRTGAHDAALALFQDALDIQEERGDRAAIAHTLTEIGRVRRYRGELEPALEALHRAQSILADEGDDSAMAELLVHMGSVYRMQGAYDEAVRACEEARAIRERLGDRAGLAGALVNLGNVYTELREISKAVSLLKEAQGIFESLGDREQTAEVLNSLASLYHASGDHARAKDYFGRSLTIFEDLGNPSRMAAVLNNLGAAAKNLGQFQDAVRHLEHSIELRRQIGDRTLISNPLVNLANLSFELGALRTAIERGHEALALKRETKDLKGEVNALLAIARAHGGLGEWDEALVHCTAALELAEKLGVRDAMCDCLLVVTLCKLRLNHWEEAEELGVRCAALTKKVKDPEFEAKSESLLGEIAWWRGERQEGDAHFISAVNTLGRLESKHHLALAYFDAGRCYGEHDEAASAHTYLERGRELFKSLGASGWVVQTDLAIGAYCVEHDPVGAMICLSEALEIAEESDNPEAAARARALMAKLRTSAAGGVTPGGHLSRGLLSALYQVGATINQFLDLDQLLSNLVDLVIRNLRADRGGIFLDPPDGDGTSGGDASSPGGQGGRAAIEMARTRAGGEVSDPGHLARDVRGRVAETGEFILGRDAKSNTELRGFATVRVDGTTSFICVPLMIKGVSAGSIYVDNVRPGHLFGEDDLDFLVALGNLAAPAIENARLYEELRLAKELLDEENVELRREVGQLYQYENFIGSSEAMQQVFEKVGKVSSSRVSVLIRGESGTGKELVAKTVHYNSERKDGPFVKLNCAALPEALVESELFGVERGTATGVDKRIGKFEQASGGTLFLDEIGDMPLTTQVKVLRVLQEREVERVGGRVPISVDVRVVSATNTDLEVAISTGSFRSDLFYRLNVVSIDVPSLRERRSDIPALAKFFLDNATQSEGRQIAGLTKDSWDLLLTHSWPGNVRELQNAIEQAVVMCEGDKIAPQHFPVELRRTSVARAEEPVTGSVPVTGVGPLERVLDAAEESAIRAVLERFSGNKTRAAEELGIARVTLYAKMKKYAIQ